MNQKFGCLLLSFCMLIPCVGSAAFAADAVTDETEAVAAGYDSAEQMTYLNDDVAEQMLDTNDDVLESGTSIHLAKEELAPATVAWTAGYRVQFQNAKDYQSVQYGRGTIYSSGCGPASLCNALYAAGIADVDLPTMCRQSVACGARYYGGTHETTLLNAMAPKYRFGYTATNSSAELKRHLQSGGVAIVHAGTSYPLFTTSGHFMAAVGIDGDSVTIIDSYWYDGKYTSTKARRNYIKIVGPGVIRVSLSQLEKATADRRPHYYLLSDKHPSAADNGDAPFTDVRQNKWYYSHVVGAYQNRLMAGVSATAFEPDTLLTRAMSVQLLYNYEVQRNPSISSSNAAQFRDVPQDVWYRKALNWAAQAGVTHGVGNDSFAPGSAVTREQFVTMLYQYVQGQNDADDTVLDDFPDRQQVSGWAADSVSWAVKNGILNGKASGTSRVLDPGGKMTRAEAATILLNFVRMLAKAA